MESSGRGAAWLARLLGVQEVASSNLAGPTSLFKPLRQRLTLPFTAALAFLALPVLAQHGSTTVVNPYTGREHERAGAALFRSQCAGCHGLEGGGTGAGPNLASGAFSHGSSDEALFRTISKGIAGTSMPGFSFSGLQIWQLVTHLRALAIAHGVAHTTGDPRSGAAAFRANCSRCHFAGGEGGLTGPELTDIANRKSHRELRDSILNPDAAVASTYWTVAAVTSDGKTVRGTRLNEDTFSLQLRDADGRLVSVAKHGLKNFDLIRRSPMPSFKGSLSDAQVEDIIAWLVSLRNRQ
jgi:cytochrome c oxidase cbb3-type subunit 3